MVLLIKLHIRRWWSFLNNINLYSDRWIQCYNLINIWLATWNSFHSSRNGSTLFSDIYDFNAICFFVFSLCLFIFVIRVQSESSTILPCSVGEHFFIAWFAFNVGSIDSFTHLLKSAISSDKCKKLLTLSSKKKNGASNSPGKMTFSFGRNDIFKSAQWLLICCHNCKTNDFYRVVRSWLVCLASASPVLSSLTDSWQLLFESSKRVRCWSLQFKMALILYVVLFQWSLHSWCGWWNDESFMLLELFALIALAIAIIMSISSFLFFGFCFVSSATNTLHAPSYVELSAHRTRTRTHQTLFI